MICSTPIKKHEQHTDLPAYLVLTYDWVFINFGNPCVLTKDDIPALKPLESINKFGYKAMVATLKFDAPYLLYDTDRAKK